MPWTTVNRHGPRIIKMKMGTKIYKKIFSMCIVYLCRQYVFASKTVAWRSSAPHRYAIQVFSIQVEMKRSGRERNVYTIFLFFIASIAGRGKNRKLFVAATYFQKGGSMAFRALSHARRTAKTRVSIGWRRPQWVRLCEYRISRPANGINLAYGLSPLSGAHAE